MNERASFLSIELAKCLMNVLQERLPGWQRAYVRFEATPDSCESKGSYVTSAGVFLFDAHEFRGLFREIMALGGELRETLTKNDKKLCVFLLSVTSDFDFNIEYEWEDDNRWKITKLNGASGLPAGITN